MSIFLSSIFLPLPGILFIKGYLYKEESQQIFLALPPEQVVGFLEISPCGTPRPGAMEFQMKEIRQTALQSIIATHPENVETIKLALANMIEKRISQYVEQAFSSADVAELKELLASMAQAPVTATPVEPVTATPVEPVTVTPEEQKAFEEATETLVEEKVLSIAAAIPDPEVLRQKINDHKKKKHKNRNKGKSDDLLG